MMQKETDVAIIGGGPAGLAAAIAAYESGCKTLIIERDDALGGILQQCIHTGFGLHEFNEEMAGPEYAQKYIDLVEASNIEVLTETMVLEISPFREIYAINKDGVITILAKSVVFAMGCRERTRGAIKIPGYRPTGVYTAGLAQRFVNIEGFIPGKEFVILGSGDIGMIMARRLTWEGIKVKAVVEILPYPSGLIRNKVQCLDDYNIPLYLSHTVIRVHGKDRVTGITIAKVDENWKPIKNTEQFISCDTLLLSIGLIPENEVSKRAGIKLSSTGGPVVNQFLHANLKGFFACGNVLHVHDLVDNVSIEAKQSGKMAAMFAKGLDLPTAFDKCTIDVLAGNLINYVLPQRLSLDLNKERLAGLDNLKFSLRVKKPLQNAFIKIKSGNKEIMKRFYPFLRPSEMVIIKIKKDVNGFLNSIDTNQPLEFHIELKNPKEPSGT
ncbi:MAG: NAD(P)/FAD-dependent oxidoreductase [Promethearchaeota archaeon]